MAPPTSPWSRRKDLHAGHEGSGLAVPGLLLIEASATYGPPGGGWSFFFEPIWQPRNYLRAVTTTSSRPKNTNQQDTERCIYGRLLSSSSGSHDGEGATEGENTKQPQAIVAQPAPGRAQ